MIAISNIITKNNNKHDISIFIYYNINIIVNRHFSHVKYIIFLNINYLLTNINILNK